MSTSTMSTGEEEGGGDKTKSKVGTQWVRQTCQVLSNVQGAKILERANILEEADI